MGTVVEYITGTAAGGIVNDLHSITTEAFAERMSIYRFISRRSLETREQKVLLPLMNDIMAGKHLDATAVSELLTDDGRVIIYADNEMNCAECSFRIQVGDPIVLDDWGWVHPLCLGGDAA